MYLSENMAILTMSISIGIGMFLVINSMILIDQNEARHFARDLTVLIVGLLISMAGILFVILSKGGASSFDSARVEFIVAAGLGALIALILTFMTQILLAAIRHHHKSAT